MTARFKSIEYHMITRNKPQRMNYPPGGRHSLAGIAVAFATAAAGWAGLIERQAGAAMLDGCEVAEGTVEKPGPTRLVGFDDKEIRRNFHSDEVITLRDTPAFLRQSAGK